MDMQAQVVAVVSDAAKPLESLTVPEVDGCRE